jgi:hypothetical protein
MLAELEVGARHGEFNEDGMASIYAALGNKDEAFRWLSEAYRRHIGGMALLKSEPRFESLRSDPRYTGLLEKMNLLQ